MASPLFAQRLSAVMGALPGSGFEALRSFAYGFAHAAAPVAVTALWQGALIAAGLALCLRLAPRVGAAHRFAAWAAGFSILVALPFVPALARLIGPNAASNVGFGTASLGSLAARPWLAHPWLEINDRWSVAIAALWVVVALARAIDLAVHTARLRKLWRSATPLRGVLDLDECSGNDARQTKFELCTTRELDRPSVIGFFAPRILIPEWLLEQLTRQDLEQVVLHEAEHLRRRDDWTNLAQKLCLVVFPLNPALAFIERRLCGEREMACDEGVVRRTLAPRAYAACLAGLAERHMEHRAEALSLGARAKALTLSAFERRPELARRVHSILVRRSAMHPVASRALVGAVGCALAVGALVMARCPQLVAFVPVQPRVTAESTLAQTAQMVPEELRGDKVIAPSTNQIADSHFRAINAMAIVPEKHGQSVTDWRKTGWRKTGWRETGSPAAPRAWETKFVEPAMSAPAAANAAGPDAVAVSAKNETAAPQELIVLTAFEQVQASGDVPGDRVVSDYGANYGSGTGIGVRPADGSAGRITITRLIFRIYSRATAGASESDGPAGSVVPGGSGVAAGQRQPTAIPTSAIIPNAAAQSTNSAAGKPVGQAARPDLNSLNGMPHAVALGNGWFVIQL
ncbi:MAG: M56 family metallopeptidase [Terracidiphilus sp.]